MKTLNNYINEALDPDGYNYKAVAQLIGVEGSEGPVSIKIRFQRKDLKAIETWAEEQQDNIFAHWESQNLEY